MGNKQQASEMLELFPVALNPGHGNHVSASHSENIIDFISHNIEQSKSPGRHRSRKFSSPKLVLMSMGIPF